MLTPNPREEVRRKLAAVGLGLGQAFITKAPHCEVPDYLAASDFAFVIINPAPCRLFCSAIKIGEYWANGLPVLLPPGAGDDSAIVGAESGGAVFDLAQPSSLAQSFTALTALLRRLGYRRYIHGLAVRHRNLRRASEAHAALLPAASSV